MSRQRRGILLFEALVGMTLLAVAGLACVALAIETAHAAARASDMDREILQASRFLSAASTWSVRELELHIGERVEGAWRVSVTRQAVSTYRISVRRNASPDADVLTTLLFRPAPGDTYAR